MKDFEESIKQGDIVDVNFNNSGYKLCHDAIVINVPCATGDSWIFKDGENFLHYVSEGCTVTKRIKVKEKSFGIGVDRNYEY